MHEEQSESKENHIVNLNTILAEVDNISGPIVSITNAVETFRRYDKLEENKCDEILQTFEDHMCEKDKLKLFIVAIYKPGALWFCLHILDLLHMSDLASAIVRPVSVQRQIRRTDLQHSRHLQTFFYQLKINIDSNTFFDRAEYLLSQSKCIRQSLKQLQNPHDLAKAAQRMAVVTWLRIQHCRRNSKLIRKVLTEMRDCWPVGVDKTLCDIIYHSKTGIAEVMDGKIDVATDNLRIAKHLIASFHDPLTKTLMCHDSRYTNQRIFELNFSEENRLSILSESENGLCFLESDSNGCVKFSLLMKRMFLLYIVMFRLKIHNDLKTEDSDMISFEDINASKNVLGCFKNSLRTEKEPLDPRRRMIYMFCKARLNEQLGNFKKADQLLSQAFDQAQEGAHFENEAINIRLVRDRLLTRADNETIQK